jgi:hypothetical protein
VGGGIPCTLFDIGRKEKLTRKRLGPNINVYEPSVIILRNSLQMGYGKEASFSMKQIK